MSLRRRLLLAVPMVIALIVGGCKINSINYFPPHPANVRVMNLMVDAPAIDVAVNGTPAYSNVAFETATGYQSFDNQVTSFAVTLSGTQTTLISFSYPLAGEQPYTVVLFGATTAPQLAMVAEVANAPTNGNIQFSVFNAAINNQAIDLYVTTPGVDIGTVSPNFASVQYGGTTYNLALAPGTYQVQATTAGTKTVIFDSGGTALTPNVALSFISYSRGSGTLVNAAILQSQGPIGLMNSIFGRMKAVNAASGVGPVNQLLGTLPVNSNVAYANASAYTVIPSGPTTVNFEASATPGAVIASTPATIVTATDASAFIAGDPGSQQAYVLSDVNIPPINGNDRLRFVNASWNSNPVNVAVASTPQVTGLAFPNASPYVQVAAATVAITFTDSATGAVLATQDVVLTANQTSTVYLIGPAGAQGILVTQDN